MTAHLAHLATVELGQIAPVEDHFASSRLVELQNRATGGRLAAAGLTHESECFASIDGKRNAVDRLHGADLLLEDDALGQREVHDQVANIEQRLLPIAGNRLRLRCFDRHQASPLVGTPSFETSSQNQHALVCPGATSSSGGRFCSHFSRA